MHDSNVTYETPRTYIQWHMAQPQKFGLTGNDPEEASNVQKTKPKSKKQVQEGKAESYYNYADMTIYAI